MPFSISQNEKEESKKIHIEEEVIENDKKQHLKLPNSPPVLEKKIQEEKKDHFEQIKAANEGSPIIEDLSIEDMPESLILAKPDQEISFGFFVEQNKIRKDPKEYAHKLQSYIQYLKGQKLMIPNQYAMVIKEGEIALNNAIKFLQSQLPLKPLAWCDSIARAAKDHASYLVATGSMGHC